jgi:membrane associated rhomboid family serine protease
MFIAIPVGMNYRTERLPLVTFTLIGLNTLILLACFICRISTDGDSELWVYRHLWLVPANCTWYAPLTSMFVHAGIFHLLGNMLFLFLFGAVVEDLLGRLRFTIFYLVCGLVAEFAYLAMSPAHFQSIIPMGGASGAISGCLGMYLLLRADSDIEFKYFVWLFGYIRAGDFEIPAWVAILFYFGSNLLSSVLGMFEQRGHHQGGVAFGAHVGGFLGGLALVAAYRWLAQRRETPKLPDGPIIDPTPPPVRVRVPLRPTAAPGETPTIYLHDGRQQTGPFTLSAVQAMLQSGEISRGASYWSEGMADWQSVMDLAGQPLE